MAKRESIGLTCPLCLATDDPEGMVKAKIERRVPPDAVEISLCRRCAHAITRAVIALDEPETVLGVNYASASAHDPARPGADSPDLSAADPLVLQTQSHHEDFGIDRPEPETAPGGPGVSHEDQPAGAARRVD